MSSPLYRRQLVTGGVNIGLVSAAGAPQNLVGEAIAGIGSAIGEAIAEGKKKEDSLEAQQEADDKKFADEMLNNIGSVNEDDVDAEIAAGEKEVDDLLNSDQYLEDTLEDIDLGDEETSEGGGKLSSYKTAWNKNLEGIQQKYPNYAAYVADPATKGAITESKRDFSNKVLGKGVEYDEAIHGEQYKQYLKNSKQQGVTNTVTQRKSPLERRRGRRVVNNTARVFSGASTASIMQNNAVPTTAFDAGQQSGYTEDRTYVQKMRRMSAPSWMGVGAAAAEGYNMSVDRVNYRKQVSADLQDYYEDKFADMEAPTSGIDVLDASLKELSYSYKKDFIEHQKNRASAFAEGNGAEWTLKNDSFNEFAGVAKQAKEAALATKKTLKEGVENDLYDWEATGPQRTDEALSFLKDGSLIGVTKLEDGQLVMGGKTRGGMGYLKTLKSFTNSPVKLVAKKNAFDYVSKVTEQFEKLHGDKFVQTQDANGNIVKKAISMDAIKPYLMRMFDAELDSESIVRSYASRNNWDAEGYDYDAFNTAIKNGENPKDFVKQKMFEVATQLLSPGQAAREEKVTGVSTAREKARLDAIEERRKAADKSKGQRKKEEGYYAAAKNVLQDQSTFEKLVAEQGDKEFTQVEFYNKFPGIAKLVGTKNIKDIDIDKNIVTFYGKSSATEDAEGGQKRQTSITGTLDLNAPYDILLQQVANIMEQNEYAQVQSNKFNAAEYLANYNKNKSN